jgi:hypothetical protein
VSPDPARLHPDVLPPEQQRVLHRLGPAAEERGFYMAGGTALALQLGHRQSVDFDWFRDAPIEDPLGLAAELGLETLTTSRDTLHAVSAGVKLSFLTFPYPLLQPAVHAADYGCRLASLVDAAAMKLAAITQRGVRKDYFDVVAIGHAGLGLDAMLEAYRRKFGVRDIGHVLTALAWFDDAEQDADPVLRSNETWGDVKATLRSWVKDAARP